MTRNRPPEKGLPSERRKGFSLSEQQVDELAMLFRSLRADPRTRSLLERKAGLLSFESAIYRARDKARLRVVEE